MPRIPLSSAFPEPAGSAGAAHFSGAPGLARSARTEALRARADAPAPRRQGAAAGAASAGGAPGGPARSAGRARIPDGPGADGAGADGRGLGGDIAGQGGAGHGGRGWPLPPSCLTADRLGLPPPGARVAVCGLVIVRQRPGSAKGVLFVTLEDETGVVNVVVWARVYEAHRRAVLAGRLLRVTGRIQREGPVTHLVAERIEDVSHLLDLLARAPERCIEPPLARADEVARPNERGSRPEAGGAARRAQGLLRGAAPRAMHPREQAKLLFRRPDPPPGATGD